MALAINLVEILSLVATFAALSISIVYRDKKNLLPIQFYIVICIIVTLIDLSYSFFINRQLLPLLFAIQNVQTLLEISLIYYFLYTKLKGKRFRNSLKIFISVYFIFCFFIWVYKKNSFFEFAPNLLGIEGLLIIIPCFFLIYEILTGDLRIDLKSNSNFIVACGILFYFSISIPIFFCWGSLYYLSPGSDKILTITNQLCFTILIISFMKAYLCPIPDQQQ